MCGSRFLTVFRSQFLSTGTGYSADVVSAAIPMAGNKVVVAILVINTSGSPTLTLYLDGSHDGGQSWKSITSTTQNAFGHAEMSQSGVDYTHVRLRVNLSGTTVAALFDGSMAFSCQ